MSSEPIDNLLIRTIALKEVLRHVIVKVAQDSGKNPRDWVNELHRDIEVTRAAVSQAAPPSPDRDKLAPVMLRKRCSSGLTSSGTSDEC